MLSLVVAAAVAFAFALVCTPLAARGLVRLRAGQPIRDINPAAHQVKRGTPTMGGLIFVVGTVLAYLAGHMVMNALPAAQIVPSGMTITGLVLLGLMVFCGGIGFVDDFLKVTKKNTAGLSGRWKLVLQLVVGTGFGVVALGFPNAAGWSVSGTRLSFVREISWLDVGQVGAVLVFIAIVMAATNAVNLTDGLDGLATGTSIIVLSAYGLISFWQYQHWCGAPAMQSAFCYQARDPLETALVAGGAAGALLGFLWWNTSPARIIMGDTGSMALGGLIAGEAVATRTVLLLPVLAALFVIITMSRIIQYVSFKTTGKRVFRMSPLHHHFELVGWAEVTIVTRFWIIAGAGVLAGLGFFYGDFLSHLP
ncbi:phospho-N-acetylmuramoyl-pentapeptide-transferase [Allocatelliglobosispora scoriae]|uniref:Phospho-N-acetylmuramoyl-pentapeptide-transferase n=1 Tax=Allocatelliglobosispora scoriae TaxID=643052 RepID=A0A841BEM6_9ACTN|nr:phospho-N-acetylmuramoyl-pentapeptide-transferase [Allocatelliglobosispora scoriae]MBB5867537.1 phospho-N-acetylmuramoyl-pentapeptide-transferase [Allocatelliglobosispora scoriae]